MAEDGIPCNQPLTLAGPAGALEAITACPVETARIPAAAVLLHPHPLHGGTMDNKVVTTLARTFTELGVANLRFNFRGVGASEGSYARGEGEVEDALAAIEWLRRQRPGDAIWLAGFSFGAYVALRVAAEARVNGLVTVAPAVHLYDFGRLQLADCPWLLVQGDADDVVPVELVRHWLARIDSAPHAVFLPGVGHFFHQRLNELRAVVREFLSSHLPRQQLR
jgi:alpha/beta superfamily hydrolase